ncbi:GGDEF domain-containing protein [Mycolicibacterium helvum]|nr:GGDEF domain-containing protein [Mycolicibacterium helvum]
MTDTASVAGREPPLLLRRRILTSYCLFFAGVYCLGMIAWFRDTDNIDFRGEVVAAGLSAVGVLLCVRRPLRGWRYVSALVCVSAAPVAALFFHHVLAAQVWSLIPLMFLGIFVRTWHGQLVTWSYVAAVGLAATAGLLLAPQPAPLLWPVLFVLSIGSAIWIFGLSHAALRDAADRDPLTGVWNRAGLLWQANSLLSRVGGRDRPLAVLVLDVDDFKAINDNKGHAAGDRVLVDLTSQWRRHMPRGAVIGRLGGDEFVVLLSGYDMQSAHEVASTLANGTVRVTVGVACGKLDGPDDLPPLLAAADDDLYRRKRKRKAQAPSLD